MSIRARSNKQDACLHLVSGCVFIFSTAGGSTAPGNTQRQGAPALNFWSMFVNQPPPAPPPPAPPPLLGEMLRQQEQDLRNVKGFASEGTFSLWGTPNARAGKGIPIKGSASYTPRDVRCKVHSYSEMCNRTSYVFEYQDYHHDLFARCKDAWVQKYICSIAAWIMHLLLQPDDRIRTMRGCWIRISMHLPVRILKSVIGRSVYDECFVMQCFC